MAEESETVWPPIERLKRRRLHPGTQRAYVAALEVLQRHPEQLTKLPMHLQKAIRLYLMDERLLTYAQCAQELGVSTELIRVRLTKGAYKLNKLTLP